MHTVNKFFFAIVLYLFFISGALASDNFAYTVLNKQEIEYLKKKKSINVYLTKDWAPLDRLEFPQIFDFLKDYLKLYEKKLNKKLLFLTDNHKEEHKNLTINDKTDLVAALQKTKKRDKRFIYSKNSVYSVYYAFAIPIDKKNPSLKKLNKQKDTLAIVQNFEKIDYIRKKYPDIRLIECATNLDALKFVLQKKASYAFGNFYIFQNMIYKNFLSGLRIKLQNKDRYLSTTKKYLTFKKSDKLLKDIFDKLYNSFEKEEIYLIKLKWLPQPIAKKVILTKKEKVFLKNHTIKIDTTTTWIPFNYKDKNNNIVGIGIDYWKLIAKKAHINYKIYVSKSFPEVLQNIKTKKFDINIATSETIDKKPFALFTKTYEKFPIAIATKKISSFITTGVELEHKKVAVGKSYSTYYLLKNMFPKINFILTKDTKEALKLVQQDKVFAAVDIEPSLRYQIIKNNFKDIYITGITGVDFNLQVMVKDDYKILVSIINKSIDAITNQERIEIYKKWMGVKRDEIDYGLIAQIVIFFIFIIGILTYSYIKQKRLKNEFENLNKTLEKRIKNAIKKEKKQQLALLQQSRLAQMGEAISMIAHQWKQPLNSLVFLNATIVSRYKNNKITKEMIEEFERRSSKIIHQMSQTVDNFRNFFKPKKTKEIFLLDSAILESIDIIKPILNENDIDIIINLEKDIKIYGYKNEFGQAVLNLINNSKDAFIEREIENKQISICQKSKNDTIIITVEDNAGGIDKEIIGNIFEPYFTTKENRGGDGIGLYMTKLIIEKHMNGVITIENIKNGAKATIILKKVNNA